MSDMTAASVQRAQERSKKRLEQLKANIAPQSKRIKKQREARDESIRASQRAERKRLTAFWCSVGKHRTEKHYYLQEEFAGGSMCMACQFKIVENLEAVLELPAVTEAMMKAARFRKIEKKQKAIMNTMRRTQAHDGDGLVYYMRINGRIKIGYTTNLMQRSRNYPPGTELLAVEPGTRDTEARRHNQFSRSLAQGREWFAESDGIKALISELSNTYGVPTELMYRHSKHEGIKHV